MNKRATRLLLALVALTLSALPAAANIWILQAVLTGDQEVPPNGSQAVGSVSMSYNDETNMFNIAVLVQGIARTDLIGSHIHQGPPGVNGPIIFDLGPGSQYVETPNGLMRVLQNVGPLPESNEVFLLSNRNYVNVHSNLYPGGEIRGQLIVVPEPATVAVVAMGLGLVVARRRRR
jgi:hypothetical protein